MQSLVFSCDTVFSPPAHCTQGWNCSRWKDAEAGFREEQQRFPSLLDSPSHKAAEHRGVQQEASQDITSPSSEELEVWDAC